MTCFPAEVVCVVGRLVSFSNMSRIVIIMRSSYPERSSTATGRGRGGYGAATQPARPRLLEACAKWPKCPWPSEFMTTGRAGGKEDNAYLAAEYSGKGARARDEEPRANSYLVQSWLLLIPPVAQPKQVATLIMISRRAMTFVRGAKIRRSPLFCRLALYLIELCSPLVYL